VLHVFDEKHRDPAFDCHLKVTQKDSWIFRAGMSMPLVKYRIKSSTVALFPVEGLYRPHSPRGIHSHD
jgi:hypothetical protein